MNAKEYVGDLNGGSLLLSDARKIAELLLKAPSAEQWKFEIVEHNILQRNSLHSALRVANTLKLRLENLGQSYWLSVINTQGQEYSQLLMLSLLIQSPIVADFLKTVVAEQHRQYKPVLSQQSWYDFVEDQCRRIPELAGYSEGTLDKMRKNLFRALAEASYIDSVRSRKLQPVFLLPNTKYQIERLGCLELEPIMECTI